MISFFKKGISSLNINENTIFIATPSGSMFDDKEVPPKVLDAILQLVHESNCRLFLCETRAETVTEEKVRKFAEVLENKNASVEIGLESANPWILKYCYNKMLAIADYCNALDILHKYDLGSSTTIIHGGPFLSSMEAVEDTVETVKWALNQGSERCCVFPAHIKKWTLLEWLWNRNLYSPPSLWSLVEVLRRLGPDLSPRVYIAWYKVYDEQSDGVTLDHEKDLEYLCSPTTCKNCLSRVIAMLDLYRDHHSFATIEELSSLECECKKSWRNKLQTPEVKSLQERVAMLYETIGSELLGQEWWDQNGDHILQEVKLLKTSIQSE